MKQPLIDLVEWSSQNPYTTIVIACIVVAVFALVRSFINAPTLPEDHPENY